MNKRLGHVDLSIASFNVGQSANTLQLHTCDSGRIETGDVDQSDLIPMQPTAL